MRSMNWMKEWMIWTTINSLTMKTLMVILFLSSLVSTLFIIANLHLDEDMEPWGWDGEEPQLLANIITTIIAMYVEHQLGQAFLVASIAMESFPSLLIVLNVLK